MVVFGITMSLLVIVFNRQSKQLLTPLASVVVKSNKKLQVESIATAELKKELQAKKILYDKIKVSSEGAYMVKLKTGEDIILSPDKDLKHQLSSLQVIYSRLTMEGRSLRKLDLRYDKPVVVFK